MNHATRSRLKQLIANLEDNSANPHTRISDVSLTDTKSAFRNHKTPPEPVKEERENLSSIAELEETQTNPVQLNVARASEDMHAEPPPCVFEYLFLQGFMKQEAFPESLEPVPTHEYKYLAASTASRGGLLDSAIQDTTACIKPTDEDIATSVKGASRRKRRWPDIHVKRIVPTL